MISKKFAFAGVLAAVLIVALFFTVNFPNGIVPIETVQANFEMSADEEAADGVAANSTFTLTADTDLSEKIIAANLAVQPEVDFEVNKTGVGEYKVEPVGELEANKVYNFTINSTQGEFSWAYQVKDTFKITGSIPAHQLTYIPVDSGIEINFSHENFDFENIEQYVEITPTTAGSFEKHRRTLAFVPKGGLKEATLYTVTVKAGLPLLDSEQKLNEDFVFQFETAQAEGEKFPDSQFVQDYYEIDPSVVPALDIYSYLEEGAELTSLNVEVFKYKNADEYLQALEKKFEIPQWTSFVKQFFKHDTTTLEKIGTFETPIEEINWRKYIYFPDQTFTTGYYLFQFESDGIYQQALVQVTELSAYVNVSLTDSLIWVNDLKTGKAAANAKVQLLGSGETHISNAQGVARFTTPAGWKNKFDDRTFAYLKMETADGKVLINQFAPYNDSNKGHEYWSSFTTDRPVYKPTDTVRYWGVLKPKVPGANIKDLTLRVEYEWDKFVEEIPLEVDGNYTFSGEVDLNNFTSGYYSMYVYSGDDIVLSHSFLVEDYVKPAYNLSINTNKKAVFAGEEMVFTVKSKFFDGTIFPNLDLKYNSPTESEKALKTDLNGEAVVKFTAQKEACTDDYCSNEHSFYFDANATLAEESNVWSSSSIRIFDSKLAISSTAKSENGKAKLNVKTNQVDLSKVNNEDESIYADYRGDIARDRQIKAAVTEGHWEKIEDGEYYDFINKKVAKKYRYEMVEKHLTDLQAATDSKGEANLEFDVSADKFYRINISSPDDQGNLAHDTAFVYGTDSKSGEFEYYMMKLIRNEEGECGCEDATFDIGEKVETVFANEEVPVEAKGSFLFMQFNSGLQDYLIQASPNYTFDFEKTDVPSVFVSGVWFDGKQYKTTYEKQIEYKTELKKLNVEIETDQESYAPGSEVKLTVKVEDQDGLPAQAAVNFNLVDEAYYKIMYNNFVDPLMELYGNNISGVLSYYKSHDNPLAMKSEGGLGGGGGEGDESVRTEFEDTALFETIVTDRNGVGTVSFTLPDNITSWRVTAKAIDTKNMRGGSSVGNVEVSLPFFADVIMNREYSVKDSPMIKFRAFGDELKEGDDVEFKVSAESLGLKESEAVNVGAFKGGYFKLPKLKLGNHEVVLNAKFGNLKDALARTVEVKGSRLKQDNVDLIRKIDANTVFQPAKDGFTEFILIDGGIAFYYHNLASLYYTDGERLDQKLSRLIAADLLKQYFGEDNNLVEEDVVANYQNRGLKLLPYSDPDLRLSALALYVESNPSRYDLNHLRDYFYEVFDDANSSLEEVVLAMLGLASINEPVLLNLRTLQNDENLTLEDNLYIALAFESLGSKAEAYKIYKEVFPELGKTPESAYASALGSMLAASFGEDKAASLLWEFVTLTGIKDDIVNLYELGYLRNSLEHANPKTAAFRVELNGHVEELELKLWESYSFVANSNDKVNVTVTGGDVGAILAYSTPVEIKDFETDKRVNIKREYFVNGVQTNNFKEGDLIEVVLTPSIDAKLKNTELVSSGYLVKDILPSGLTLVSQVQPFIYYTRMFGDYYGISNGDEPNVIHNPYRVNRQEVYFRLYSVADVKLGVYPKIKYLARVVNPGEFYAEPTMIQSYVDNKLRNISEEAVVIITAAK